MSRLFQILPVIAALLCSNSVLAATFKCEIDDFRKFQNPSNNDSSVNTQYVTVDSSEGTARIELGDAFVFIRATGDRTLSKKDLDQEKASDPVSNLMIRIYSHNGKKLLSESIVDLVIDAKARLNGGPGLSGILVDCERTK